MTNRKRRLGLGLAACMLLGPALGGCASNPDTLAALADLASSSAGSVVQILLNGYFTRQLTTDSNVDPAAPISEQQH